MKTKINSEMNTKKRSTLYELVTVAEVREGKDEGTGGGSKKAGMLGGEGLGGQSTNIVLKVEMLPTRTGKGSAGRWWGDDMQGRETPSGMENARVN